jgi:putative phosphoribosyl transferase
MGPRFQDRFDAGRFLAERLNHHAHDPKLLVLALPRGGVPVGFEVAFRLCAPLDVFVVRKLPVPGHDELSMGIVASGGQRVLNSEVVQRLNIPEAVLTAVERDASLELASAEQAFRGRREAAVVENKNVILVDDGLATGHHMRAALLALRKLRPASVIAAVPIGSPETCSHFQSEVDELICGESPEPFFSVGTWYADFLPITDGEIRSLLDRAAHECRVQRVKEQKEKVTAASRH